MRTQRFLMYWLLISCLAGSMMIGCVDMLDQTLRQHVNVVVVDGGITNLAEPQLIWLNRSKSDSLTGRFGSVPLSGARVQVVVDSTQLISFQETTPGRYQGPEGFVGQVGHRYQLRFTLSNGVSYQSNTETMPSVASIDKVQARFNPASLETGLLNNGLYRGAHEFFIDWQDPADEHNYYRWDWKLWEKQTYCRSCAQGIYLIWDPTDTYLAEACFPYTVTNSNGDRNFYYNDYTCRTPCWEIIPNYSLNVFDDQYSNGGLIKSRPVAQIPFYDEDPALVEIRQASLSPKAYLYYKLVQDQTQTNGGVADTPPTILTGNLYNVANRQEGVVGFFTASAISSVRYWLDRRDATGRAPGLFFALNGRHVSPEDQGTDPDHPDIVKPKVIFTSKLNNYPRPPLATCLESDSRTPRKPTGWQD